MIIKRIAENKYGTFGVIIDQNNIPFALTLERQWLSNKTGISCIPNGIYMCRRVNSPHFGDTFEITDVPDRTHILFHKGNLDDDSHGCVILAEKYDPVLGSYGVKSSGDAFKEFRYRVRGVNNFGLEIMSV